MQFAELASHAGQYTLQALGACNFGYIKEWWSLWGKRQPAAEKFISEMELKPIAVRYARGKKKSHSCAQQ
jgi:hypothetical protein